MAIHQCKNATVFFYQLDVLLLLARPGPQAAHSAAPLAAAAPRQGWRCSKEIALAWCLRPAAPVGLVAAVLALADAGADAADVVSAVPASVVLLMLLWLMLLSL